MDGTQAGIEVHMIDRLLIERGLTRKDLAEKLGVDPSTVTKWLTGVVRIPERWMVQIAKALGVDSRMIFPDRRYAQNEASKPAEGD